MRLGKRCLSGLRKLTRVVRGLQAYQKRGYKRWRARAVKQGWVREVKRTAFKPKPCAECGSLHHSKGYHTPKKGFTQKPKKRKKPRTLEQKTAQQLVKPTDDAFSKYIRLRDSWFTGADWRGKCITCNRPLIVINDDGRWIASSQNGHFISRGVHSLRFDEFNCNLQCAHCNAWMDKEDMLERYRNALDLKYGDEVKVELKRLSKLPEAYRRAGKAELLQIIADSKEYINHALNHPENYLQ